MGSGDMGKRKRAKVSEKGQRGETRVYVEGVGGSPPYL